jgi:hypothetical protein
VRAPSAYLYYGIGNNVSEKLLFVWVHVFLDQ